MSINTEFNHFFTQFLFIIESFSTYLSVSCFYCLFVFNK